MPRPIKTEKYKCSMCIYDVLMHFYNDAISDFALEFGRELNETGRATRRVRSKKPEMKKYGWKIAYLVGGVYFYCFSGYKANAEKTIEALEKKGLRWRIFKHD